MRASLRHLARRALDLPVLRGLQRGYPDEARRIVQEPALERATARWPLHGTCLDAGSGEGLYSAFIERFPGVTEIIDVDVALPRIPERRADGRHRAEAASLTALPLADASIAACLCTEVLEHIEDDASAVAELSRVLKPGGIVVLSVPTPPAPRDPAHVREGYELRALCDLLGAHGLSVDHHEYCFHLLMRALAALWRWQYEALGRGRRSWMPRFVVRAFGRADRRFPVGRPWDLVVVARRVA